MAAATMGVKGLFDLELHPLLELLPATTASDPSRDPSPRPRTGKGGPFLLSPATSRRPQQWSSSRLFRGRRSSSDPSANAMEMESPVVDPADFSSTMAAVGPGDRDKEDKLIPVALKEAEFSLTVAAVSPSDRDKEGKLILVALKEGHHVLLPEHTVVLKSTLLLTKPDFSSTVVAVGPGDRDKEGKWILVALKERDRALLP